MKKKKDKLNYFVLKLEDINTVEKEFDFDLPHQWLENSFADCKELLFPEQTGKAKIRAIRDGNDIYILGTIQVTLIGQCVSCLEPVKIGINANVNVVFIPKDNQNSKDTEEDFDENEIMSEYYEENEIVLDNIIREFILLDVPMNPKCSETCDKWKIYIKSDKKEEIKKMDKIDPRWQNLKKIKIN